MSTRSTCRACDASGLVSILDLGRTPLANALLTADQLTLPEPTYPLVLVFCPVCTLVQITETVPPELLFSEYFYFSSFSDEFVAHAGRLAERLSRERGLNASSLVLEVASNDGYLLQHYVANGIPVLGIEPARNVAAAAEARGVRTLNAFFTRELAERLAAEGTRADVLHANNVMAHVPDLGGFMAGIAAVLQPNGIAVIEAPYVRDLIETVAFDTIYHEHLCYFSLTSVVALAARHGLVVADVEHLGVHGGSLRYFIAPGPASVSAAVTEMLAAERAWGVADPARYQDFGKHVEGLCAALGTKLAALKAEGKRIVAYGASAKGSTLLNTFGIGRETLGYVVDRSTVKQGHYTPGTHLAIAPVERLLEDMPDHVLLLSWNFANEILAQQAEYRRRGGRFIVPIPELREV